VSVSKASRCAAYTNMGRPAAQQQRRGRSKVNHARAAASKWMPAPQPEDDTPHGRKRGGKLRRSKTQQREQLSHGAIAKMKRREQLAAKLRDLVANQFPSSWAESPTPRQLEQAFRSTYGQVLKPQQHGFKSTQGLIENLLPELGEAPKQQRRQQPSQGGAEASGKDSGLIVNFSSGAGNGSRTAARPASSGGAAAGLLHAVNWRAPSVALGERHSLLHAQMVRFSQLMLPAGPALQAQRAALRRVATVARATFPGCTLELFGSNATGLALPSSDFDVALSLEGLEPRRALQRLQRRARATGVARAGRSCEVVKHARVPIFKFVEAQSGAHFDVCVNSTSGARNSSYMRRQMVRYPQLRPLLLVLKSLLRQQRLQETYTGGVGSYLLFAMALQLVRAERGGGGDEEEEEEEDSDDFDDDGEAVTQYVAESDDDGDGEEAAAAAAAAKRGAAATRRRREGDGEEDAWLQSVFDEEADEERSGEAARAARRAGETAAAGGGGEEHASRGGLGSWKGRRVERWSDDEGEDDDDEDDDDEDDDEDAGEEEEEDGEEEEDDDDDEVEDDDDDDDDDGEDNDVREAEATAAVECGDLGELLHRFVAHYARASGPNSGGPAALSVDDPMSSGVDIGAKAFRFAEAAKLFARHGRKIAQHGDAACLSSVLEGWPAGQLPESVEDLGDSLLAPEEEEEDDDDYGGRQQHWQRQQPRQQHAFPRRWVGGFNFQGAKEVKKRRQGPQLAWKREGGPRRPPSRPSVKADAPPKWSKGKGKGKARGQQAWSSWAGDGIGKPKRGRPDHKRKRR